MTDFQGTDFRSHQLRGAGSGSLCSIGDSYSKLGWVVRDDD
jgi:hypothetical protein